MFSSISESNTGVIIAVAVAVGVAVVLVGAGILFLYSRRNQTRRKFNAFMNIVIFLCGYNVHNLVDQVKVKVKKNFIYPQGTNI